MNAANLLLFEFVGHMRFRLSDEELRDLLANTEAEAMQAYLRS